jgi:ribonuclease HII
MSLYNNKNLLEAGVDEVARGCLAGPVYAAAVIWPNDEDMLDPSIKLKDSKKLSKEKRSFLKDYIEEYAIDFAVASVDNNEIDEINILQASQLAMRKAIAKLDVQPESLLIDGNYFKPYVDGKGELIPHECFVKGDDKFQSISAASILAKVYHDEYIENLVKSEPSLEKYDWQSNMCYGTKKHIEAIKEFGITKYHRKTFGICKEYL